MRSGCLGVGHRDLLLHPADDSDDGALAQLCQVGGRDGVTHARG